MSGNRVVVHKRNPTPSPIDQLGTTIPMAELFAAVPPLPPPPPKHLFETARRLVSVPPEIAATAGDLPEASVALRSIQALVFDMDALFAEASIWHLQALNLALRPFGVQIPLDRAVSSQIALETLTREHRFPSFLHKVARQIEQFHAAEQIQHRCWPRPETELLLSRLRQRGYRLALRSGATRERTSLMLERAGWREHFEVLQHAEDAGNRSPDPETFAGFGDRMGLRPDQILAIETAPRAQEAALRAGAHVCALRRNELADWIGIQRTIERIESSRQGAFAC